MAKAHATMIANIKYFFRLFTVCPSLLSHMIYRSSVLKVVYPS